MNRFIVALALTPALLTTGALAQTVGEDVSKELWCGTALVVAFSSPPEGVTSEQMAQAQVYIDGGNALIDDASTKYLAAGFSQEQLASTKSTLTTKVTDEVSGDGSNAEYTFEDCVALLPAGDMPSEEVPPDDTPSDDLGASTPAM